MLNFFKKPSVKAKLVNKGTQVKVNFDHATPDQIMTMLFITIQEFAKNMKVDPRYLMNKIIDLDKTIIKNQKVAKKEAYKLKHK